jgi:hypothetical protein
VVVAREREVASPVVTEGIVAIDRVRDSAWESDPFFATARFSPKLPFASRQFPEGLQHVQRGSHGGGS